MIIEKSDQYKLLLLVRSLDNNTVLDIDVPEKEKITSKAQKNSALIV